MSSSAHADQPLLTSGAPLTGATAVVILLHGRGAVAEDVLRLARHFPSEGVCYLAPQAAGNQWYPQRFLAPLAANEPLLASALAVVARLIEQVQAAGISRERILLGGFSQGACLALEAAVRAGGRFGGVFALAGAVIGPPGEARPRDRRIESTPVFIGCGDVDSHIPLESAQESARVLVALGANVDLQIYRGLGHTIIGDEISRSTAMIQRVLDSG